MAIKKIKTHKFDHGSIANAFGNMLKLKDGPDRVKSSIWTFCWMQKWPKYIKMLRADSIPQTTMLNGIKKTPAKCFSFFGFKLERLIIPPTATVSW